MDRPEKSAASTEEVEMVSYNQDEKHEAEDKDFNVWDGNPFPPIPGVSEYYPGCTIIIMALRRD